MSEQSFYTSCKSSVQLVSVSEDGSQEIGIDLDIRPHSVHNDPKDDIIIISNDYVKFRASRFHLIRTSQFFEGLLGIAKPNIKPISKVFTDQDNGEKAEPIHLEFSSCTISLFLNIACSSHPCLPALKTEQATALLDFVEFAICDDFIDLARTSLINSLEKQPLELLVVASRRNDLDMAKQALRQIDEVMFNQLFNAPSVHPELAVKEYLRRLTRPYHLAILDAASTQAEDAFGVRVLGSQLIFTNDWSSFADTFSLDQFT